MTPAPIGSVRFAARPARAPFALAIAFLVARAAMARAAEPPGAPAGDDQTAHPAAPAPMSAEARAHYEQGLRLYGDHDFPAAIREFEAGFALEPRREFLFGEAQAYRLAGDCARAVPLYERFLGSGPSALQVDATRLALDRCARRPPPKAAPPAVPAPAAAPPIVPPRAERAPWWHDRWALGALGAGLATTGVGLGFVIAAHSAADQANGAGTMRYADYNRLWDLADHRQTIGVATMAAGGALLAAGAFRLVWVRHTAIERKNAGGASAQERTSSTLRSLTALVAPTSGGARLLGQVNF